MFLTRCRTNVSPWRGLALSALLPLPVAAQDSGTGHRPVPADLLANLPLAFVENDGQWQTPARFVARRGDLLAYFQDDAACFRLRREREGEPSGDAADGVVLRMAVEGAREGCRPEGEGPLDGRYHFLRGPDPDRWRQNVPSFSSLVYRGILDGVDLRFYEAGDLMGYDFLVAPGTSHEEIVVELQGADSLSVDPDGSLDIETCIGRLSQTAPVAWYEDDAGERHSVACRFELAGGVRFAFAVEGRPLEHALVIDPGLEYSTFLGGIAVEMAAALHMDANGVTTLTGWTGGFDFPVTPGAFQTTPSANWNDAFVTRLSADGSALVWSTFLGEDSGDTYATDVAVDRGDGSVVVVGSTLATAFPTTAGAFDTTYNGQGLPFIGDAFVTRLRQDGAGLIASTYLGSSEDESAYTVVLDETGAVIVGGVTYSAGFPVTAGAWDTTFNGTPPFGNDGFVTRLADDLSALKFSTFLGGSGNDQVSDMALRPNGNHALVGITSSTDFPTSPGAFDTTYGGNDDAFFCILGTAGNVLGPSTYLGGSQQEMAPALAPQVSRNFTIVGGTASSNFPTTAGAFDTTFNGGTIPFDAYVTRLNGQATGLVFSTFLGGAAQLDLASSAAVDSAGRTVVAGATGSSDFPTTVGAFDTSFNGGDANFPADAFVTRLNAKGSGLIYSTFVGGSLGDNAGDVLLDAALRATYIGTSQSTDYPTTPGAFQTTHGGSGIAPFDAVVTRLDLLPTGVDEYGFSTPACLGPIAIGVDRMPVAADASFAIDCVSAPPSANGFLLAGVGQDAVGTLVAGVTVFVDLSQPHSFLAATSDTLGFATTNNLITGLPPGTTFYAQYLWFNSAGCGPGTRSASNAIEVIVQ